MDAVPVTVTRAAVQDVPLEIQAIGNVEAYATVSVKAQITGPILQVHFGEGDFVKRGDLLFTIDPAPFEAQLSQAEATLARDEAMSSQAEANRRRDAAQAKFQLDQAARYQALLTRGIIGRDQAEQIQASADALSQTVRADEAAIKSSEAAVAASRAAVVNTRIQLGYTEIRSPLDGRTGNLTLKAGNVVSANTIELISINQVQPIYVTFAVPEAHLPRVKQFMAEGKLPVTAIPQDSSAQPETGVLTFIDNNVDMTTGTIKLKGTFGNAGRKLWPGQFARVTLKLTTQRGAVVVPSQAVQIGQDGAFVYVVKADQTVEARPVEAGTRFDQGTVIQSGLAAGDTVVTEGQLRLAPGMKIRLREGRGGGPQGGSVRGGGAGAPQGGPARRDGTGGLRSRPADSK